MGRGLGGVPSFRLPTEIGLPPLGEAAVQFTPNESNVAYLKDKKVVVAKFDITGMILRSEGRFLPKISTPNLTDSEMISILQTKKVYETITDFEGVLNDGSPIPRTLFSAAFESRFKTIWETGDTHHERTITRLEIFKLMHDYNKVWQNYFNLENVIGVHDKRIRKADRYLNPTLLDIAAESAILLPLIIRPLVEENERRIKAKSERLKTEEERKASIVRLQLEPLRKKLEDHGFRMSGPYSYIPSLRLTDAIDAIDATIAQAQSQ